MVNFNSTVYSNVNYCSTLVKSLNVKSLFSTCSSAIRTSFYEQSLFFAANNEVITEKSQQYKALSWTQKFKIGVIKGGENILIGSLIAISLSLVLSNQGSGQKATSEPPSILEGCAYAVVEEVLFRGGLQNCLAGSQRLATYITPQCLQNNRVFKWFTSPSARIISINAAFAAIHLFNGGDYISDKGSFIQTSRILLQPIEGILHETTGNIIAPIACHMTNNFVFFSLGKILR